MVTLTVFTVGYGEVRPIDTGYLHLLTMGIMAFGCTGVIFLSGALVQFMTLNPLQQMFGVRRMQSDIDKFDNHIIVCGYDRVGVELAKGLKDAGAAHVVLEQNERRVAQARDACHLSAFRAMPPTRRRCKTPALSAPARSPACCRTMQPMSLSR